MIKFKKISTNCKSGLYLIDFLIYKTISIRKLEYIYKI